MNKIDYFYEWMNDTSIGPERRKKERNKLNKKKIGSNGSRVLRVSNHTISIFSCSKRNSWRSKKICTGMSVSKQNTWSWMAKSLEQNPEVLSHVHVFENEQKNISIRMIFFSNDILAIVLLMLNTIERRRRRNNINKKNIGIETKWIIKYFILLSNIWTNFDDVDVDD